MNEGQAGDRPMARVWGVGALVQAIGDALAARFSPCVVRGELGAFTRAASGHGYFTLKDEHGGASLRCAMFRRALGQVGFAPREGMLVEVRGTLAVYEARGELQLVVDAMRPAGQGALYEQFLRLKSKLEAEGLFDAANKRGINPYPVRVGLVTSLAAAALHDVVTVLARRAPHVEVVLAPASVQGVEAPAQIVNALSALALFHRQTAPLDAVLLCRGGGSLEDLWSFNDERVVRAVAAHPCPIVCGVGHETDVTLADFAADLRAPTPTAAAELIARDALEASSALDAVEALLSNRLIRRLDQQSQRLDQLAARLSRPASGIQAQQRKLDRLAHLMEVGTSGALSSEKDRLDRLTERGCKAFQLSLRRRSEALAATSDRLQLLDPKRVLERGYAWLVASDGNPIHSVKQVGEGSRLEGVLSDGVLQLDVKGVS